MSRTSFEILHSVEHLQKRIRSSSSYRAANMLLRVLNIKADKPAEYHAVFNALTVPFMSLLHDCDEAIALARQDLVAEYGSVTWPSITTEDALRAACQQYLRERPGWVRPYELPILDHNRKARAYNYYAVGPYAIPRWYSTTPDDMFVRLADMPHILSESLRKRLPSSLETLPSADFEVLLKTWDNPFDIDVFDLAYG